MATSERAVCDQDVRDRVSGDLHTSFLLEAGAGTGKTKVLVDRYVRCVLDPENGTGDVRRVAAITFTEKAAGELRQRVREAFEARAQGTAPASVEAVVIARALEALDDAPISTIHGFAGRLLREFPVEAGVDPAFEQLDGLASEVQLTRLWEEWLTQLASEVGSAAETVGEAPLGSGVREPLVRLLRAGVQLKDVRALAMGAKGVFAERYDIEPVLAPPGEPDLAERLDELAAPTQRLRQCCAVACSNHSDKGFIAAMDLVEAVGSLLAQRPDDLDQLAAALYALPVKTSASAPGGNKLNWSAAYGGKEELQACYRELAAAVSALRDAYAGFVTGLAIAVADAFSRWAGATQIDLGYLDFTDLLGRLRDVLAHDFNTRQALQQRFRYLLVDEFQDTDPLQAEVVFFLSERQPLAADWREVVLEPGKLFVVGDPKQSIYRFRRADISLYDEVKALIRRQPDGKGVVTAITQNFRTTPAVLGWVNHVFADVFDGDQAEGRQPGYQWVEAYRPPVDGSRVVVLLGREYGQPGSGGSAAARGDEARALAALLAEMHDTATPRWRVQNRDAAASAGRDRAAAGAADGEATRPPRWGDIAVLFRTTTSLETYEQALRDAGVPYRVDGGSMYFTRREVADALLCLRVVDDPADGPALYGALHSSFFGFSDEDLFLFSAAGGRFDLFAGEQPPGHDAVVAAIGTLRRLHERHVELEPYEVVSELVRCTHGREFFAAAGSGAAQAIANLEKLIERARAFADAGGGGLGAFLRWAGEAGDLAGEQESQVGDQGDVVHLLTVHKAKGLEYPIVVVAGGALAGAKGTGGELIVDRSRRRLAIKLKAELPGTTARALESPSYALLNAREKEMAQSETRRLLYVAATRARDWLVVTSFGKLTMKNGESSAGTLLGSVAGFLPPAGPVPPAEERDEGGVLVLPPGERTKQSEAEEAPDAATMVAARDAWLAERGALLQRAAQPFRATSPSGLEQVDDEVRCGGPGAPPGRARALALGTAVHRILELCDLNDELSLGGLAVSVTREVGWPDLAARAAALAAACWRAAPVRAAASSPEVYRELPVATLIDGNVVSGAVDVLYRDGTEWVVVDYKTDRGAGGDELRRRYAPQAAAYAVAVEAATGGVVREVVFVAAGSADEAAPAALVVTLAVDDALRALALHEVRAAVAERRAVAADEFMPGALGHAGIGTPTTSTASQNKAMP